MKLTQEVLVLNQQLLSQDKTQIRVNELEVELKKKDEYVRLLLERNKELGIKIEKMKEFYFQHMSHIVTQQAPHKGLGQSTTLELTENWQLHPQQVHYIELPDYSKDLLPFDQNRVFLSMPDVMGQPLGTEKSHRVQGSEPLFSKESPKNDGNNLLPFSTSPVKKKRPVRSRKKSKKSGGLPVHDSESDCKHTTTINMKELFEE